MKLIAFALALLLAAVAQGQPPPNVLVVVADDLGWGECPNGRVPTPALNTLAAGGCRWTSAYSCAPVCCPSRIGMMLGMYPQRTGAEFNPKAAGSQNIYHMSTDHICLAEAMALSGYATGLVGKWHLGDYQQAWRPNARGFDEFFGFTGSQSTYLPGPGGTYPLKRDETTISETEYLTFAIARESIDFIQRHEAEPWFLYVSFNAVHAPNQAPQAYLDMFAGEPTVKKQQKSAMTRAMDDALGGIVSVLPANTLVIFWGDNGGTEAFQNLPFTGGKDFPNGAREGGIRVPAVVAWPGVIEGGQVISDPVSNIDIMPTVLSAAGELPPPETEGVDLLPRMTGDINPPHSLLFWRSGERRAVRDARYKARQDSAATAWKLYDLWADPDESSNLAAVEPVILAGLVDAWAEWNLENASPLWQ